MGLVHRCIYLLTTVLVLALSLVSCGQSPEGVVSGFFNEMNQLNIDQAKNYVCGDVVLLILPVKGLIKNLKYQTLDNKDNLAHVRVRGELSIEGLGFLAGKKEFDFVATVKKDIDRSCIVKDPTFTEFLSSLTTLK